MAGSKWLDIGILLVMILLSGWVSSQFGQITGRQQEANIASYYSTMALVALVIALAASVKFGFLEFEGLNKDPRQFLPLLVVGAIAGFLLTSAGRLALTKLLGAGAIDPTLSFTFVVILAVFVEEYFFRGALFPSIERFLGGRTNPLFATVIAAVVASFLFASFHIVATNGDAGRLSGEFVFSIFQIFMLKVTGSLATPIGAHFARNLITAG